MISSFSQLSRGAALWLPVLVVGALLARAPAQCATQWLPGAGIPGTNGYIMATTMWDPDGGGPMQPVLVVGGTFTLAGTVLANNIATFDPLSGAWSALGSGMDHIVRALSVLPNGDLVAGGAFSTAGGVSASRIARWNGISWSGLGAGIALGSWGWVSSLTTLLNGDLVAAGSFTDAGGVSANRIARWNGASWSALGSGMDSILYALTTLPNGDLVAGGTFTTAGGVSASNIARWDGTSWSALAVGMNFTVQALTTLPNGDLVAGGYGGGAGGVPANNIARWDGTIWSALGLGTSGGVWSLTTLTNGDLVAGGEFTTAGGVSANGIARWDGSTWSGLGTGMSDFAPYPLATVYALTALSNGDLVAGGFFDTAGGVGADSLARWNGTDWSALGPWMSIATFVQALTPLPNGDLVFADAALASSSRIARWDGASGSALGPALNGLVHALTTLPNGDLVAGGDFTQVGGLNAPCIARWDGASWSALGSGMTGWAVLALMALPNGDLVAGGDFTLAGGVVVNSIARWDGTNWSALGTGMNGQVCALATLPNGDLVASGSFSTAGGVAANNIARWNGTSWSPLAAGHNGSVMALTTLPNGDLVAAVWTLTSYSYPTRWNGVSWNALGGWGMNDRLRALTTLPNGDLVAGGDFTTAGGVAANRIARWNGTSWSPFVAGMNSGVVAFATLPNGDLAVGGYFTVVNGAVSTHVARLTTTCPATTVSYGSGCAGSGGPHVLTATTLPWTGSTFRSVATGMPNNALAVGVRGPSTTSVPLSSILPQGVAGCTLRVNPDLLDLYVPTAGSVQTQFAIPNTVVLAGQIFHQQIVPVELDALGNIIAVTSTNRLTLTIGTF